MYHKHYLPFNVIQTIHYLPFMYRKHYLPFYVPQTMHYIPFYASYAVLHNIALYSLPSTGILIFIISSSQPIKLIPVLKGTCHETGVMVMAKLDCMLMEMLYSALPYITHIWLRMYRL